MKSEKRLQVNNKETLQHGALMTTSFSVNSRNDNIYFDNRSVTFFFRF